MATVEIFYDFSCPFAYLGSTQIEALCERVGAELVWRPFLLGGVFRALYGEGSAPLPAAPKARHGSLDLRRWSRFWDVPLAYPKGHPVRTVDALRAVLASPGLEAALSHRFFKGYWVDHVNLGDGEVLARLITEAGGDAEQTLEAIRGPEPRERLRAATDEALERGVFGAPTFFIGGDFMVWGQDRLEFVARAAEGWRPDAAVEAKH
jgi:2-hydroxychromene-2-carboxylate isomerase